MLLIPVTKMQTNPLIAYFNQLLPLNEDEKAIVESAQSLTVNH